MFNGKGIVRIMGRPTMAQIIIFPNEYNRLKEVEDQVGESSGIHTLQTATHSRGGNVMIRKGM